MTYNQILTGYLMGSTSLIDTKQIVFLIYLSCIEKSLYLKVRIIKDMWFDMTMYTF